MEALVSVHSVLRWLVLLAALAALGVSLIGWLGDGLPERTGRQAALIYVGILDLQVLLGIIIWVFEQRCAGGGRQFQFEHPLIMLLALIVTHIAAARARRNPAPKSAAQIRSIGIGLGLILILVGIPWSRL